MSEFISSLDIWSISLFSFMSYSDNFHLSSYCRQMLFNSVLFIYVFFGELYIQLLLFITLVSNSIYYRNMESSKANRIRQFVVTKIKQVQIKHQKSTDPLQKLKLSITLVSFAHILSQFFRNPTYEFEALIKLSRAYISTQNYQQALVQARLAKKQAQFLNDGSKQKTILILAECKVKQNKFDDACEVLQNFCIDGADKEQRKNYYQLLLNALVELGQQAQVYQVLAQFEKFIQLNYGQKTIENGFYLIVKGKSLGKFEKYEEALTNLRQAIDILIENKCKEKKLITNVYLTMSEYYKKQGILQKQYSSLICAHSMARQLEEPDKSTLPIVHALATNLIERQEYTQALKQLKKAKELQKQLYGESSNQIGRTTKKILELLNILNLKGEARKCEQEYSRILGTSGGSIIMKQKTNCI